MKFVPKALQTIASVAVVTVISTFVGGIAMAAPNEPPPPSPDPTPPGLPIDSRIVALVLLAVLLGCYKVYQSNYKKAPR